MSRNAQNREIAASAGARMARPTAPRVATVGSSSDAVTAASSTPFGSVRQRVNDNEEQEWCGPFSVARQFIKEREEKKREKDARIARRRRRREENGEDHASGDDDDCGSNEDSDSDIDGETAPRTALDNLASKKREDLRKQRNPSLTWQPSFKKSSLSPSSNNQYVHRKRQRDSMQQHISAIPSLASLCVNFLVDNFECIESLGFVDSEARTMISRSLVEIGKLDDSAVAIIAGANTTDFYYGGGDSIESIEIPDASKVSENGMCKLIKKLTEGDRDGKVVLVGHAGLAVGDKAAELLSGDDWGKLGVFSVEGAYVLHDQAIEKVLTKNKEIRSLTLNICHLMGEKAAKGISGLEQLQELSLEHCPLQSKALSSPNLYAKNLRSVSLACSNFVDDGAIKAMSGVGCPLAHINLSKTHVTDQGIFILRQFAGSTLRSLELEEVLKITNEGLKVFFEPGQEGAMEWGKVPSLRRIVLSNMGEGVVCNDVFRLLCEAANAKGDGDGLDYCDFSGAGKGITDKAMEHLAKHSKNSLTNLDISFCHEITNKGIGHLCAVAEKQFKRVALWGNSQLTDDFFDGHGRGDEFCIEGIWLKRISGGEARGGGGGGNNKKQRQ